VSDLTTKEQRSVRTTLLFLRVRAGNAWEPVARALHVEEDTIAKVAHGRRPVTARLAIRVARLIEVGVDDLLAGHHLSSRVCSHCGHPPDDFVDEETVVTDRALSGGLAILDGAVTTKIALSVSLRILASWPVRHGRALHGYALPHTCLHENSDGLHDY